MELREGWNLPLSQAQKDGGEACINCTHILASALIPQRVQGTGSPSFVQHRLAAGPKYPSSGLASNRPTTAEEAGMMKEARNDG